MNELSEGWRLVTRDAQAAPNAHRFCTVCGRFAGWLWEWRDRFGVIGEVIPVCEMHFDRFARNPDDPNQLTRTDTTAPRGTVLTRDELADYLHHCHFIAHQRGLKSASHWKLTRFGHPDLMKQLQALRAVKRSDHFSGWEPREGFIQATLLRNGTWEVQFRQKNGAIRVRRCRPTVKKAK